MKLRIKDNSIRFRLTKTEVNNLAALKLIKASTCFGEGPLFKLTYCLSIDPKASYIEASFDNRAILVKIPEPLAKVWTSTDQVALQHSQKIDDQNTLKILIEKDFFCLKPRQNEIEDESDMFQNPSKGVCGA